MKKKVSIFSGIQGHWSIAQAIQSSLSSRFDIYINKHHGMEFESYKLLYRYAPKLFGALYDLGRLEFVQKKYIDYSFKTYSEKVAEQLVLQKPDYIISTWFALNPILDEYSRQNRIPFVNVVANPRTIHPLEISSRYPNLVFDRSAKFACIVEGVPERAIEVTGWFVQPQFALISASERDRLRLAFGIKPNVCTVLFQNGSDGGEKSLAVLEHLFRILPPSLPVHIVFACGNNQALLKKVQKFTSKMIKPNKFEPLPFIADLYKYIQMADVVVGKAGPNTLFETIACGVPFFATYHIAGQEDGNLDIIQNYNLGYVEENPLKAARILAQIISQPETLSQFSPSVHKLMHYNQQASDKLIKLLDTL